MTISPDMGPQCFCAELSDDDDEDEEDARAVDEVGNAGQQTLDAVLPEHAARAERLRTMNIPQQRPSRAQAQTTLDESLPAHAARANRLEAAAVVTAMDVSTRESPYATADIAERGDARRSLEETDDRWRPT